ncbi:monovalent cation:H+ antiporter, CPA1 (nhx1), partial [Linderina pennispora]
PLPEEEEKVSAQALLILVSLLIMALLTSYYLQRWRIRTVHETVLSIFAGMAVGLVLRFSTGHYIKRMVTFDHTVFFNMLLPPIILNCGYGLQKTQVGRNLVPVLTFAFLGTAISAVVIGVLVQVYSWTGIERIEFSLLDSLILGTILSATDPVTILAVFEQLKVEPKLFSIIFGETVFNDAVAIVLFVTLSGLRAAGREFTLAAVPGMLGSFMFVFSMSLLVGVGMGVMVSLMCKHTRLYEYPSIEASLVLLISYQSYLFANAIELSGIVSLLFCAATTRQYAYKSLSKKSKRATRYLFHLLSGLAENFVFIYLGISLFTAEDVKLKPVFIVFVMVATCISRYSAIFPLARVLNAVFKYRHPSAPSSAQPVTHEEQTMLFWAGLRGAVAVALASEVSGENGALLRTTVLCVVVLSVTIFGGTTPQVVQKLGIRTGVGQPDSSDDDDGEDGPDGEAPYSYHDVEDGGPIVDLSNGQAREEQEADGMESHAMAQLPASSFNGFVSSPASWRETGESWLARIRNSYRSVDRSLITDIDAHYIQPFLTRDRAEQAAQHRPLATQEQSQALRQAYSSEDFAQQHQQQQGNANSSSWADYYPDGSEDGNWGSSASDLYDMRQQQQQRSQQPLLKKST